MNRLSPAFAVLVAVFTAAAPGLAAQSPVDALGARAELPDPVGDASQELPRWTVVPSGRAVDDPPGFPGTPGGPSGPPAFPSAPNQVPVDGSLTALALAGAAYGARRLCGRRG